MFKIVLAALALCSAVAAASECQVSGFNLATIPQSLIRADQLYNGVLAPYDWSFNICNATHTPLPKPLKPCDIWGAVGQYQIPSGDCDVGFTKMVSAWKVDAASVATATFESVYTRDGKKTAIVTIACGKTLALQPLNGNATVVYVDGSSAVGYTYHIALASLAMCKAPVPVTCSNINGHDLSKVPATSFKLNQEFAGVRTAFDWSFDLCNGTDKPPAGKTACNVPSFVTQYAATSSACTTAFDARTVDWYYDATKLAAVAIFSSTVGSVKKSAIVQVVCGKDTTLPLKPVQAFFPITSQDHSGLTVYNYFMELKTSAMC
jgi:hypothetical protein